MLKIAVFILISVVLILVYVRYLEYATTFVPERRFALTPDKLGLSYEDVILTTEDHVKIHGWYFKTEENAKTLLFTHGNAGNIGDRLEKIQTFIRMGLNVFIFDYRGYGQSQGRPSEKGIYVDAMAAYDFLIHEKNTSPKDIILFGASLGSVPALEIASRKDVACVILDSPFTRAIDMAKVIYPFIPNFLVRLKLDAVERIKKVSVPILIVHSEDDAIVPFYLGERLFEAASQPKTFLKLNGDHVSGHIHDFDRFVDGMKIFLKESGC